MSVETFSIAIDNPKALLAEGDFVAQLEQAITKQLPACQRLIRWAIVGVSQNQCSVEGAYLQ